MAYAIPDWDFLLKNPDLSALKNLAPEIQQICIPRSYLPALANLPAKSARQIYRYDDLLNNLTNIFQKINQSVNQTFLSENLPIISTGKSPAHPDYPALNPDDPRHQALLTALYLHDHIENQTRAGTHILTYQKSTVALAAYAGIKTILIPPEPAYTGRRQSRIKTDQLETFYEYRDSKYILSHNWLELTMPEPIFRPNEYTEIINHLPEEFPANMHLYCFDDHLQHLRRLYYFDPEVYPKYAKITPRNAGQAMLLDALLAPADEIPIVIAQGPFGTGKTFLSVAAACAGIHSKSYNQVIVCPRDSKLGDDIGSRPGNTTAKTRVKARGIIDNLREVMSIYHELPLTPGATTTRNNRTQEFIDKFIEFIPLVDIGGSSLSHSFILYDEFQDMTLQQARALVTRLGDRSKVVIMGDPDQINNPQLSKQNNGLRYLVDRLAGKPGVALVTLNPDEIVRHQLLHDIASYL